MNVKNDIHHPFTREELVETLKSFPYKQKLIVVTLEDAWRGIDTTNRNMAMDELELLLKNFFEKIVFHQEQKNSYTKILRE